MLTEEQKQILNDILENRDLSDKQRESEYGAKIAEFKTLNEGKTNDPRTNGADVDQENAAPESTGSDSEAPSLDTYEKYQSNPDKYVQEIRDMRRDYDMVSYANRSRDKETELKNRKVDLEKISEYKLDTPLDNPNKDLNWKSFKKNAVKNEDGSYTGANGRIHTGEKAILDAYEDITFANNGLDFEKVRKVNDNIKKNEKDLKFIDDILSRGTTVSEQRRDIGGIDRTVVNETYQGTPEDIEKYPDYFDEKGKIKKIK